MEAYPYSECEKAVLERSGIPFAVFRDTGERAETVLISDGFVELFAFGDRESTMRLMDSRPFQGTHPDDVQRLLEAVRKTVEGKNDIVYRCRIRGNYHLIHAYAEQIVTASGVCLEQVWYADEGIYEGGEIEKDDALVRNLSAALQEVSLRRRTSYDALTGLPNMTSFYERAREMREEVVGGGRHCVLGFADFNGMKYYNKKHGFAEGDRMLQGFAEILAAHFGKESCCRIAQDNFAFFALRDGLEERLKNVFAEVEKSNSGKGISVRMGLYPDEMGVVETALACDRARAAANTLRNGNRSGYCFFDVSMLRKENNRQYVLDNLDRALEEHWIQAYYQPIVRAANGRVCDEEALARWIDPEKGMLSPADFIPILEDSRQIYRVDLYMVDEVIRKMKDQKERGMFIVPVSVNLSRTDFDMCDIVGEICNRVDLAGIDRGLLTLEITESVMGTDFDFMKSQVERMRALGFRVWMDDFGSGYSSLDLLQSIHFDLIKLDMRFMKQFDEGDRSRVIVTELIKMAIGLGIDTVTEGVETAEMVEFLREVGCTKLQGYYYGKPISYADVLKKYEDGLQIGFENPEETEYYATLGRINLYDVGFMLNDSSETMNHYFNALPMAIIAADPAGIRVVRCNRSYRDFVKKILGREMTASEIPYSRLKEAPASELEDAIRQCMEGTNKVFIDERLQNGDHAHGLVSRVAKNPVTGIVACTIAVLGLVRDTGRAITYADIANSLSADFMDIFYVNIETEEFVEYHSDRGDLAEEKQGRDFFSQCRRDALIHMYKDDGERFAEAFHKEKVLRAIDDHGAFTIGYRLMQGDEPIHVSMKALRMRDDNRYLIIGVNDVDAQMRTQEALQRMQEERITYARISALAGNFIAIYTVDPNTDRFMAYGIADEYGQLGLETFGEDFFEKSRQEIVRVIYPEDKARFDEVFTKEIILRDIRESGVFALRYRLMIGGKPTYVLLKAALVEEKDGPQIVVGLSNVEAQVHQNGSGLGPTLS